MFRNTVVSGIPDTPVPAEDLIPLSHLRLDLPEPGEGWSAFLAARNVDVEPDDLGRPSVTRNAARMLIAEHQAGEARKALLLQDAERRAVEADQRRRASIWRGVPADALPVGVSASAAMLQAAKDAQPRRTTPLEEALSTEMTYHRLSSSVE